MGTLEVGHAPLSETVVGADGVTSLCSMLCRPRERMARFPGSALLPTILGEGSPTKIDYRKKGTPVLASLLEDLGILLQLLLIAPLDVGAGSVALRSTIFAHCPC